MANINDEEKERTLWCGNLHPKVTEEILYELFLQAGPLEKVKLVKNKNYAFITFKHAVSVPFTIQLMNGIQLFHKPIQLQTRTTNSIGLMGQAVTPSPIPPSPIPFPPGFNPMLSSTASTGSRFMPTPPTSPAVALNPGTRESATLPYHRSMSQPNFTNSQNSGSELHFKVGNIGRDAPGKMQPVVRHTNQRPNLPYTRSTGYDQRFDRNVRNTMGNQFPQQMMTSSQMNGMAAAAALLWANNQLTNMRRY